MNSGIYKIQNSKTNKIYIGKSIDIQKRVEQHKASFKNNTCNDKLKIDLVKFGFNSFNFTILGNYDIDKLEEMEGYFIRENNSIDKGYNMANVADYTILDNINCDKIVNELVLILKTRKFNKNVVYFSVESFSERFKVSNEQIKLIIRRGKHILNNNDIDIEFQFFEKRFKVVVSMIIETNLRLKVMSDLMDGLFD